ncbi:DUF2065 domain-containing protein [Lacimicrobium alkaliphilum]|uniref:DUF2065 domain-containing protein n=1 Tax=Lacimicrobium alkaliphilum TaxID=1526571 RepID=A0ABQ1RNY5_9ALTE|nr:DUF2065 domain-containing protein [Lacimicrobium alkaliphilum]GGD76298.1 hypothetical protein GCM10011357_34130 [Lacimicrobium alkaliphilum]
MSDAIWLALAMVLIIEGIGPMLFPNKWQQYIQQLAAQPPSQLRTMGGIMVIIGAVTLFYLF